MYLSIPYNGDLELLKIAKERKYPVKTVYGKRLQDVIGGGRARYDIANYSNENLKEAIKLTHEMNAEFNYLFNAPCSANAEKSKEDEILKEVQNLIDEYKIDIITIANPNLLRLLKRNFPQLKYSVSTIAKVDSLEKVLQYQEEGANEITLDYNIYRNFPELERIKKNSKIGFQLIANDGYIFNCPWATYHFQLEGHDSQNTYNNPLKYFSYCRFNCKQRAAQDPNEMIKGMWIRPEDVHYYEDIGFTKLKIIDRLKETKWLINAIEAYINESYSGNLSDILCSFDTFEKDVEKTPKITERDRKSDNIQNLRKYWDLKPYIDNTILEKEHFLEHFVKNRVDCRNIKCDNCRYCEEIAKKAVTVSKENADNVAYNLDFIKEKIIDIVKEENN